MEQKQKQKRTLIGPGEAAAMLDVSTEYLRRDRLRPEGPTIGYVKLPSGRVRYRASEIERVLAGCTVDAVEPEAKKSATYPTSTDPEWLRMQAQYDKVVAETEARVVAIQKSREAADALDPAAGGVQ